MLRGVALPERALHGRAMPCCMGELSHLSQTVLCHVAWARLAYVLCGVALPGRALHGRAMPCCMGELSHLSL